MKKSSIAIFMVIALILAVVYSQRTPILSELLQRGIEARFSFDQVSELEDGLHLALCGAGGPMPAANASGPCVAVVAGQQLFIVDAGTNGVRNLARMGYQVGAIDAVLLTHFHSDHIDGLGELGTIRWVSAGNTRPLPVFGPEGVQNVVNGFNIAYKMDFTYRNEHHGGGVAPMRGAGLVSRPFNKPAVDTTLEIIKTQDLTVEAFAVDHSPVDPAVGYRFTYKDRTLLITGDTVKTKTITSLAKGVDLLVHEALAPNLVNMMNSAAIKTGNEILAKITYDILDYHASPLEAAQSAKEAKVGHLLYYHIVPPLVLPGQKALFLDGADDVFSRYTIGQDGVAFSLPTNSKKIIKTSNGL